MSKDHNLLEEFIREKEVQEKRSRRRKTLLACSTILLVAIVGFTQIPGESIDLPALPSASVSMDTQPGAKLELPEQEVFLRADVMPRFPGGEAALYRFLSHQIHYPEDAAKARIEGKVFVRFIIDAAGNPLHAHVVKGIGFGCDEEARRVVENMPKWVPGEIEGEKVPVYSSLAIEFKFL